MVAIDLASFININDKLFLSFTFKSSGMHWGELSYVYIRLATLSRCAIDNSFDDLLDNLVMYN